LKGILGSLIGLAALVLAGQAMSGDTASLNVLGYSPDGKVFAFEEYGVFDGSGFPYSNIYFIDIEKDKFLPGTPIRTRVDEELALPKVRGMTRAKAALLLEKYKVEENPGVIVVYNPPSELDSDGHKVRFQSYVSAPPHSYTNTLVLTERKFPPTESCLNMTGEYTGFTLKLTEYQGTVVDKVLHEDTTVPASRSCPNAYSIGAVISSEVREVTMMAMIQVGSFGFEGNDRRWIAVPVNPYGP
jgi:predicted secreted protein